MDKPQNLYCQYCGKECKNLNSLRQHEIRCKQNSNRLNLEGHSKGHKGHNQYTKALELGLENQKFLIKLFNAVEI